VVIFVFILGSMAAQTLTPRYRGPGAPALRSLAIGSTGLVAVGDGGYVLTSLDRQSWAGQYLGVAAPGGSLPAAFTSVTYGNGRYIAVGDGGQIWASPDGTKWSNLASPTVSRLNGVAYQERFLMDGVVYAERFVAAGENGTIVSSKDGALWKNDPSPTQHSLRSVTVGGMHQTWFSIVGAGGTWLLDASGRWEAANSGTTADLNVIVTDFYAYYVSSGGLSYWEPRGALAGGAGGTMMTLSRTSYRIHTDLEARILASPTTARVRCVLAGRPRTVAHWHPSHSNSTTTYATRHVLVDEQGKVFWAAEREPGEQTIREWKHVATINEALHGGVWSPAEELFYLIGDASTIYTIGLPAAPAVPVVPPTVPVVPPPPVVPVTPPPAPERWGLANASVRGFVSATQGPLIAGIVVPGPKERRVLIRGIGPGLAAFGVANPLARPRLTIYGGSAPVAEATELENDPRASVLRGESRVAGAFPLDVNDAAVLATLAPGTWTAVLTSADGGAGAALIEVYLFQ
jgi:hypothetical protein